MLARPLSADGVTSGAFVVTAHVYPREWGGNGTWDMTSTSSRDMPGTKTNCRSNTRIRSILHRMSATECKTSPDHWKQMPLDNTFVVEHTFLRRLPFLKRTKKKTKTCLLWFSLPLTLFSGSKFSEQRWLFDWSISRDRFQSCSNLRSVVCFGTYTCAHVRTPSLVVHQDPT